MYAPPFSIRSKSKFQRHALPTANSYPSFFDDAARNGSCLISFHIVGDRENLRFDRFYLRTVGFRLERRREQCERILLQLGRCSGFATDWNRWRDGATDRANRSYECEADGCNVIFQFDS